MITRIQIGQISVELIILMPIVLLKLMFQTPMTLLKLALNLKILKINDILLVRIFCFELFKYNRIYRVCSLFMVLSITSEIVNADLLRNFPVIFLTCGDEYLENLETGAHMVASSSRCHVPLLAGTYEPN